MIIRFDQLLERALKSPNFRVDVESEGGSIFFDISPINNKGKMYIDSSGNDIFPSLSIEFCGGEWNAEANFGTSDFASDVDEQDVLEWISEFE